MGSGKERGFHMQTQEAVVIMAAGGVIATIKVQAVNNAFDLEAMRVMGHLIEAAVATGSYEPNTEYEKIPAVVGWPS